MISTCTVCTEGINARVNARLCLNVRAYLQVCTVLCPCTTCSTPNLPRRVECGNTSTLSIELLCQYTFCCECWLSLRVHVHGTPWCTLQADALAPYVKYVHLIPGRKRGPEKGKNMIGAFSCSTETSACPCAICYAHLSCSRYVPAWYVAQCTHQCQRLWCLMQQPVMQPLQLNFYLFNCTCNCTQFFKPTCGSTSRTIH